MGLKYGFLDQSIIFPGQTANEVLINTINLAKEAERLGFNRFWVSEHHNSQGIAGSSPEVLVSHILAKTERISVGSGGVMLQHYSPYKVAENFNVLANLSPNRVELGIGRAPGGFPKSSQELQKNLKESQSLEEKIDELENFLYQDASEVSSFDSLQASPLPQIRVPLFLLGTSVSSAKFAAKKGYPYAFALFINNDPVAAKEATKAYHNSFNHQSGRKPKFILALSTIVTETEEEALKLSDQLQTVRVTLGNGQIVNLGTLEQAEIYAKQAGQTYTTEVREADVLKGTKETFQKRIFEYQKEYGIDEFIFTSLIPDFEQRVRSLQLMKEAFTEITV
ncbi:LLM class flavin-dependent oxidoreductase [Gottfriedia acidiceleris]|uniref:LLM class flavin-dependent oxidoreductase n=1 Tax=Gottfriedia acidiceleris TaxID=371036 RepID=A0ABY4JIP6_9BACI|nr:LLM class flavin-dependent oxidoreductase [Gottfriedia acidiceleris]UPM53715.1 LLM class flavin-dependent oxidoreductase [Gottfriedia acidiceleris]